MEECSSFLAAMRQVPPSKERNVPRWGFEKPSNGHDISTFRACLVNVIPFGTPGVEGGRPGSVCIATWGCFSGKSGAYLGCPSESRSPDKLLANNGLDERVDRCPATAISLT